MFGLEALRLQSLRGEHKFQKGINATKHFKPVFCSSQVSKLKSSFPFMVHWRAFLPASFSKTTTTRERIDLKHNEAHRHQCTQAHNAAVRASPNGSFIINGSKLVATEVDRTVERRRTTQGFKCRALSHLWIVALYVLLRSVLYMTLTLIYGPFPLQLFTGIWLRVHLMLVVWTCLPLKCSTGERRCAWDGWQTSQHWFISCSVLYCKQGVVKQSRAPKWARFWEEISIPRLHRYQQSDVARIKNKWVWDFDVWFSFSAHMGALLWNMNLFFFIYICIYIFYFGKCTRLSVWALVERNAGLSDAGLFICKQSQPVLFMSFKLHFHRLRQSAAIVPRNNVLC